MLQIAVPSRTDVREYQELKEEMDQLVGRINGCFTTPNWSPIRYIYGCVSQDELAAFYRLVTRKIILSSKKAPNIQKFRNKMNTKLGTIKEIFKKSLKYVLLELK